MVAAVGLCLIATPAFHIPGSCCQIPLQRRHDHSQWRISSARSPATASSVTGLMGEGVTRTPIS